MTANNNNDQVTLASFEAFLEVHGSNRSRWPAQQRLMFASLLASSPEARRLLAEAEALDGLLDRAEPKKSAATPPNTALVDRIMKEALGSPMPAKAEKPAPAAFAPAASAAVQRDAANVIQLRPAPRKPLRVWPIGAVMAASLLLGLTTGITAMTVITPATEVAASETTSDTTLDPTAIALDDADDGALGGDLL